MCVCIYSLVRQKGSTVRINVQKQTQNTIHKTTDARNTDKRYKDKNIMWYKTTVAPAVGTLFVVGFLRDGYILLDVFLFHAVDFF